MKRNHKVEYTQGDSRPRHVALPASGRKIGDLVRTAGSARIGALVKLVKLDVSVFCQAMRVAITITVLQMPPIDPMIPRLDGIDLKFLPAIRS